jgi:hypothetical protein
MTYVTTYSFVGEPPIDFSEKEILEAFQVFIIVY